MTQTPPPDAFGVALRVAFEQAFGSVSAAAQQLNYSGETLALWISGLRMPTGIDRSRIYEGLFRVHAKGHAENLAKLAGDPPPIQMLSYDGKSITTPEFDGLIASWRKLPAPPAPTQYARPVQRSWEAQPPEDPKDVSSSNDDVVRYSPRRVRVSRVDQTAPSNSIPAAHAVFISYRRSVDGAFSGRLYDMIESKLGEANVFRDVSSIMPGADYRKALDHVLKTCKAMIVIITENWLHCADEAGRRRLDNDKDWVRLEIQAGLRRGIPIFPVLSERAVMPKAEYLPKAIRELAYRQKVIVTDVKFKSDVGILIDQLVQVVDR